MYLTAEIQARDHLRAELDAKRSAFLRQGGVEHRLPGPGEPRTTDANHLGVPKHLPTGEQTQHIHRRKALDKANWQVRQAMIDANGDRLREEASKGAGVAAIALALKLTRADVRTIAAALGVTLSSSKRKQAEQPTLAQLADQVETKPALSAIELLAGRVLAMAAIGKSSREAREATGLKPAKFKALCSSYGITFDEASAGWTATTHGGCRR